MRNSRDENRMMRVADFAWAFKEEPDSLCSEMVLAYLRASGRVAGNISRSEQRLLFVRLGPLRALDICGKRLGFRLAAAARALAEGDAVLLRAPDLRGGHLCALIGADGQAAFAKAGDGLWITTAFSVARVAKFD